MVVWLHCLSTPHGLFSQPEAYRAAGTGGQGAVQGSLALPLVPRPPAARVDDSTRRQAGSSPIQSINQSITFKVHGEPAGVSWDWAGGEGCVSGVHSIGRGTVRCGRRLAGPARPVGWKLRAGISVRSGCGGWCRGGNERGSVPRLLWDVGSVPLPRGHAVRMRAGSCDAQVKRNTLLGNPTL